MFNYIKFAGDEPVIIEDSKQLSFNDETIIAKSENVYFLVQVMTREGSGQVPVSADDQGFKKSECVFQTKNITMIVLLSDDSEIVQAIKESKLRKSGIITPKKSGIIV